MNLEHESAGRRSTRSTAACEDFSALLTDFFEGEGGEELRGELEEHTRHCSRCAEILRSYIMTIRVCRGASRVPEPAAAHEKLWEELLREISALKTYLR